VKKLVNQSGFHAHTLQQVISRRNMQQLLTYSWECNISKGYRWKWLTRTSRKSASFYIFYFFWIYIGKTGFGFYTENYLLNLLASLLNLTNDKNNNAKIQTIRLYQTIFHFKCGTCIVFAQNAIPQMINDYGFSFH